MQKIPVRNPPYPSSEGEVLTMLALIITMVATMVNSALIIMLMLWWL